MNLATWVERHGRRRPADAALADGERVHASWAELAGRVAGGAGGGSVTLAQWSEIIQ